MRHAGGSILITLVALACGVVLGVFVERWHTGTLVRSDVVCAASRHELQDLEADLAQNPSAILAPTFSAYVERAQTNIARNCGWLPPTATFPPPRPTEAPKPAAPPKAP